MLRNHCEQKVLFRPEHWNKMEKYQPWFHFPNNREFPDRQG